MSNNSMQRRKRVQDLPDEKLNQITAQSFAFIINASDNEEFKRKCMDILKIDHVTLAEQAVEQLLARCDEQQAAGPSKAKRARKK